MEENPVNDDEASTVVVFVAEGPKGFGNELQFTPDAVIAVLRDLGVDTQGLQVTNQVFTPGGVLRSMDVRAPGSDVSYTYELTSADVVSPMIHRVDYDGPDSQTVSYSEVLADYKDGVWVKQ